MLINDKKTIHLSKKSYFHILYFLNHLNLITMPISNMISIEFTATELKKIDDALTTLETVFKNKLVQLTPKESQRYGKLGSQTENWSNMIYADSQIATNLIPPFIDQKEWTKDEIVRDQLSLRATRLENIAQQVLDTNRVIGFDIYQTCHAVYNNCKYLSSQNMPGAKAYYEKWSAQFPGSRGNTAKKLAEDSAQKN